MAQPSIVNAGTVLISLDDTVALQDLDDYYLGVNIDTGSIYNGLNFTDPLLIQLASNLAPAQARTARASSHFERWKTFRTRASGSPASSHMSPAPCLAAAHRWRRRRRSLVCSVGSFAYWSDA